MQATDAQVRIALSERAKGKTQQQAAAKANLRDRGTVARYENGARLPWEPQPPRSYRTRRDPFEEDWQTVEDMLTDAPTLEAKALFEWLSKRNLGRYLEGQLRTFQRRVSIWKAINVPRMVELPQDREPGEVMQTDGTWMNELGITLAGEAFEHLLIHSVLPYSNWEWATVSQSESLMAVAHGFQTAVAKLGHLPKIHQTDSCTAATHKLRVGSEDAQLTESGRVYNERYLTLMKHYGVTPRTTHLGAKDENGDVEAMHGSLKRCLEQHLQIRGSRDFADGEDYRAFLENAMTQRNQLRLKGVNLELAAMKPLTMPPLETKTETRPKVSRQGTVRILENVYSVPSGLVGRTVTALVDEWTVEIHYGRELIQRCPRLVGRKRANVNYRHILPTLLRKPGGFRRYRYHEHMFPTATFREAWDDLDLRMSSRRADLTYLRVLKLAAEGLETDVHVALALLLEEGGSWDESDVEELVRQEPASTIPMLNVPDVDLLPYDALLLGGEVSCGIG